LVALPLVIHEDIIAFNWARGPMVRGSGGKNVIFSNGPNSTSECSKLLY
jgi:hypothetical protein